MTDAGLLEKLVAEARRGAKYQHIGLDLVQRIAVQELAARKNYKEALKATRSRLHQVAGAYQEGGIDYAQADARLSALPPHLNDPAAHDFCRQMLRQHASTRERLPILERFFHETLAAIAPVHSVLDLACGLTPLALPWMPLAPDARYYACDIYHDLAGFLNRFFAHFQFNGQAQVHDLLAGPPAQPAQLALLLKTLPCLEQVDRSSSARLLASLPARHVLVSFPAHSLGGRAKGMPAFYEAHFTQLIAGQNWQIQRFEFPGELAFLLSRPTPPDIPA